jgi:DNA-directed RNA polymerase II subunit RPB1
MEMNLFLPQSIQTQIELEEIADVKKQIINPSTSKTIIGVEQDGLVGSFNLTDPTVRIDWKNTMNIISYTSVDNFKNLEKKEYTGQELFGMIIPPKINLSKGEVKIVNGEIKGGKLTKDVLGAGKQNSIHQLIWDEYGAEETVKFLNNNQRLINNFNLYTGFSIGIDDIAIKKELEKQIYGIFSTKDLKVAHMITELENNPELMDSDLFEKTLYAELNVIRDDVAKLIQANQDPKNQVNIMAKSGSKGDATNSGQMSGCVGMQAVSGQIIQKKVNGRALPYFFQNDDRGDARGLIKPSFTMGMRYPQFFFLNQAGREGLIDGAIKTAESGYIQRKLVKTLEDLVIKYDSTLRTVNNTIIQFIYGDTGADTRYQYEYNMKLIEQSNADIENVHKFTTQELKEYKFTDKDNEKLINTLINMRNELRHALIKSKLDYITLSTSFLLPVNITRIINSVKNDEDLKNSKEKLDPQYIIDKIDELMTNEHTKLMCLTKDVEAKKSYKIKDEQINKTSLKYALYDCLSPKRAIVELGLNKKQFDSIFDKISDNYNKNIIQPGEHAGVLSAQAMGEPTTQMTLKAFHQAGIAAISNTLQGVPRVKELLSLSKKIKTPQMIVYLNNEYYKNKEMAHKIASYIRFTTLGQIKKKIEVIYDPNPYAKDGFMEKDNVYNIYYTHNPTKTSCQVDINNLPWLMRIELDREKMLEKEVTLLEIKSKFCNQWEKRYSDIKNIKKEEKYILDKIIQTALLSNTDNDEQPVIHLRFDMTEFDFNTLNEFIDIMIEKFKLKGISGINERTAAIEERVMKFDDITGGINKEEQYVIYTQGVNLMDIRYLIGIDVYKTICNDVVQMYETFGIEAARATIVREIALAYKRHGADVNYNHLSVIVDLMTSYGMLMSVDRHGMNKSDNEPLARVSFEKMVEQLITSAVFNEVDNMKSVSSRIMAGLVVKGGTGMCNVVLDTELLEKSEFTEDLGVYDGAYKDINTSSVIQDTIKKEEASDIFMPM